MFRLTHVPPEQATGKMAEVYAVFPPGFTPPAPMVLMSASPGLAEVQAGAIRYFLGHERLDLGLLAMIRYLVAREFDYEFCIDFNAGLLRKAGGMSLEELEAMSRDPMQAPLEESQKALLCFVLKAVRTPDKVTREDIRALRDQGWRDSDIMDAVFHGASMYGPATLFKAFTDKE